MDRNSRTRRGCSHEVRVLDRQEDRRFMLCVDGDGYRLLDEGDTIEIFGRESWFGRTIEQWARVSDSTNAMLHPLRHTQYILQVSAMLVVGFKGGQGTRKAR